MGETEKVAVESEYPTADIKKVSYISSFMGTGRFVVVMNLVPHDKDYEEVTVETDMASLVKAVMDDSGGCNWLHLDLSGLPMKTPDELVVGVSDVIASLEAQGAFRKYEETLEEPEDDE